MTPKTKLPDFVSDSHGPQVSGLVAGSAFLLLTPSLPTTWVV